jgi:transcription antitermination protein NusB
MTRAAARRRSRSLALQGLYQRQLAHHDAAAIRLQLHESPGWGEADAGYFDDLWRGVTDGWDALIAQVAPHLDRKPAELSPIERAILVIGAWELQYRLEVPYRVVINEAVELAKSYGGTDGHRFVNGVLDKVAGTLRAAEIAARTREAGGAAG